MQVWVKDLDIIPSPFLCHTECYLEERTLRCLMHMLQPHLCKQSKDTMLSAMIGTDLVITCRSGDHINNGCLFMTRAHIDQTRPCKLIKVAETVTITSSEIGEPVCLTHHLISEMTIPPQPENFQISRSLLLRQYMDYLASVYVLHAWL